MILEHLNAYGRACYEYDFAAPTPWEQRLPVFESIKRFVSGEGKSPFDRQAKAARTRDTATQTMLTHTGGPRKWLFQKLLRWAQETAAMREDAIFYMGMGHPLIRRSGRCSGSLPTAWWPEGPSPGSRTSTG